MDMTMTILTVYKDQEYGLLHGVICASDETLGFERKLGIIVFHFHQLPAAQTCKK
jgi:hypothetical protein